MIAEFATYINPLIVVLKELGGSARPNEACTAVAEKLSLSDEILEKRLKNGTSRFENQVHWARFYLAKTGYIDSSSRGVWALTEKGATVSKFTEEELRQIIRRVEALTARTEPISTGEEVEQGAAVPEEEPMAPGEHGRSHREQLLSILKSLPPNGFERLCQRLLREAGFEKVTVTGRPSDGGIDGHGVLQLSPFVSFRVLFQCKRYDGNVGSSVVRDFRGAMMGRADKGIILTTGSFTAEAQREAARDGVPPIELADGTKLLEMFEELELGLVPKTTYELDTKFFEDYKT